MSANLKRLVYLFLLFFLLFASGNVFSENKKPLTLEDMMKFKYIHSPVISVNGKWLAYNVQPGRGDGEVIVQSLEMKKNYHIDRGKNPSISQNEKWAAATIVPPFDLTLKKTKNKPKNSLALLNLQNGMIDTISNVKNYQFSEDGEWICWQYEKPAEPKNKSDSDKKQEKKSKYIGADAVLRRLETKSDIKIPFLRTFSFDSLSQYFVYSISDTNSASNGLFFRDLQHHPEKADTIYFGQNLLFSGLSWHNSSQKLSFYMSEIQKKDKTSPASLYIFDFKNKKLTLAVADSVAPQGWQIPFESNQLNWSKDGKRLFFGLKPEEKGNEENTATSDSITDIYDIDSILKKKEVDVWHWNDPLIIPEQKKVFKREKKRTYRAVYFTENNRFVQLADKQMPTVVFNENPTVALGLSNVPYLKETTWDGNYYDVYLVKLETGEREKIKNHLRSRAQLSPGGNFIIFYENRNWHLFDIKTKQLLNLTKNVNVPFFNEDHDYPYPAPGYGIAGWLKNDEAVLIYDKYDIWEFPTNGSKPTNLTDGYGRKTQTTFRVQQVDRSKKTFSSDETILLRAYHQKTKNYGFYEIKLNRPGKPKKLIDENKKFTFIAKAKNRNRIIYSRESYNEFPDIWVSDIKFKKRKKVTRVNPQIQEFAWGTAELVEWNSVDGIPLQGVLIKPGNYKPGERYPVLVYFYRFFSQRLYEFNEVVINHRPCFPYYASNGYAVFLPDIRFEVGRPGFSATKCIVPGVQKLIDMGIADPKAIALHGHSWSGYQTAFVITQTNIFACAVAGAPVSNMTSAYSGIRWGSGKARQFQYEKTQSRIGGSLWEYPERYIENSPVFFADKIHTPLLIMHGDEDGAVPWYQSIELYLAMRRLGKECVFLEYRGEPHHPQKFPNKLDYTIRMKQFLDHYCKKAPAPDWLEKGIPYQGK